MYFTVWPFVRELARKVVGFCLPGAGATWVNGGFTIGSGRLTDTFTVTLEVYVPGTPAGWPGRGGGLRWGRMGKCLISMRGVRKMAGRLVGKALRVLVVLRQRSLARAGRRS